MNENPTDFYIICHAESRWFPKGLLHGHIDVPLTSYGESQAKSLANTLQYIHFDEVFSSDLIRARRTAEVVALERQLAVKTTHVLRERNYGIFEGTNADDFHALYTRWNRLSEQQKWEHKFADEESHAQSGTRFITFIRETAVAFPGKRVLIVSHSSLMRTLVILLGYGTWQTVGGFLPCGYIHLESDGVDFFMKETQGIRKWHDLNVEDYSL